MKRIACLHGHFSNISLIDDAFASWAVELVHYVDPGLLIQTAEPCPPTKDRAHDRLRSQLSWMQASLPDAIVITCTQYAACLTNEDEASLHIPVFTIDGSFFDEVANRLETQALLFSNPATVAPTMKRLREHASVRGLNPQIEIHLAEGAFALLMENNQHAYHDAIWGTLQTLSKAHPSTSLAVAQLSMVPIARAFAKEKAIPVSHPLQSLTKQMVQTLSLSPK